MTRRSWKVVLTALAVLTSLMVVAPGASATDNVRTERLGGDNRYETAANIAKATFSSATTALLARGDAFPDALAGSSLAGARNGPVLLTQFDAVPAATESAMRSMGVRDVILLGGPAAISENVRAQLATRYNVSRVAGETRYGTAAEVARRTAIGGVGSINGKRTAFLATGLNFPDALGAGPLGFAGRHPIFLTRTDELPQEAESALRDLGIEHVVILGGAFAISDGVKQRVESMGMTTQRLAGGNRFQTAVLVADFAVTALGFEGVNVDLARGDTFPDALAGGPNGGRTRAPILLTSGACALATETRDWLTAHYSTVSVIRALGGPAAICDAVLQEAKDAASTNTQAPTSLALEMSGGYMNGGPKWQGQQAGASPAKEVTLTAFVTGDEGGTGGSTTTSSTTSTTTPTTTTTTSSTSSTSSTTSTTTASTTTTTTTPPPSSGTPASRQQVVFNIRPTSGDPAANTELNLEATTDSQGRAVVRYSRSAAGRDTVTARVKNNSSIQDTGTVVWRTESTPPIALTPETDETRRVAPSGTPAAADNTRTYTITLPQDPSGVAGREVNITALEMLDNVSFNDPNESALIFTQTSGAANTAATVTQDTGDGDKTLAVVTVPPNGTAQFDVRSMAPQKLTFLGFVDSVSTGASNDNPDPQEIRDKGGATTWLTTNVTINVTPTTADSSLQYGQQRVFTVSAVDSIGQPFLSPLDVSFVELTDNEAGTTTRLEIAWYDNDNSLRTTPADPPPAPATPTGHEAPPGTTAVPDNTTRIEIVPNEQGRFTFAVTVDPGTSGSTQAGTPVAWYDLPTQQPNVRESNEPQGQGGRTTFNSPASRSSTVESFGCPPTRPAPTTTGTFITMPDPCQPLNFAAASGGQSPTSAPGGPSSATGSSTTPPKCATSGADAAVSHSRGDTVYRFTFRNAAGQPVSPGFVGESEVIFDITNTSSATSLTSVCAARNGQANENLVLPPGGRGQIQVPLGGPYAEIVVDANNAGSVRVEATAVDPAGVVIAGCGTAPAPGCSPIVDTSAWVSVAFDTTVVDMNGSSTPGQTDADPSPLAAGPCPVTAPTRCFNGTVVALDKAREYYVIATNAGNVYVVYAAGRGSQLYAQRTVPAPTQENPNATVTLQYGERPVNTDTYFIDGVQTTGDLTNPNADAERCGPAYAGAPPNPPAPGCGVFDFNVTPDDRVVYEYGSLAAQTQTAQGTRPQVHRLTNSTT